MSSHYLYDGQVLLNFDEGKHLYTVDGIPVTSVTGILKVINKPALMPWAALMTSNHWKNSIKPGESYDEIQLENIWKDAKAAHRQKSGDAASIGTLVHNYAEAVANQHLNNGPAPNPPVNKQAVKGVDAFEEWLDAHEVRFIEAEFKTFSRAYLFAGTCDLDCEIDGKRTLLDYKTSSGIYPEMHFQTAAYAKARNEERGIEYDQRAIVLFDKKTGKFKVEYRDMGTDFDNDWSAFKGALMLHRALESFRRAA